MTTENAKRKTRNAKPAIQARQGAAASAGRGAADSVRDLFVAAVALGLLSVPAFGQLPGLPASQAPAAGASAAAAGATNEDVRPGPVKQATITPAAPIRGSLFRQGAEALAMPAGLPGDPDSAPRGPAVSFIAVEQAKPKKYKKNDIVTVIIQENSDSTTGGTGNSKKTQAFDLALQQFLQVALSQSGVPTVGSVGNPSNLPEVKFNYNNDREATAEQDRSDTFSARISATVLDVKPNGTLVVEATKQIAVDKETQTFTLSGTCRVEDIQVDNTVLSTQLADLRLSKQTKGSVHDGTKQGWLSGFIDKFSPF